MNAERARGVPAFFEVRELLRLNLWATMALATEMRHNGRDPDSPLVAVSMFDEKLHEPKGFYYFGEVIENKGWPVIVVGGAIDTVPYGVGFGDTIEMQITVAYHPEISASEWEDSWNIAQCASGLLWNPEARGPYYNEAGQMLWSDLQPAGYTQVPASVQRYQGWIARFRMTQPPGQNLWTVPGP